MNVNCRKKHVKGATLLEACLASALIMVSAAGSLATFQLALQLRKTTEAKGWALIQMESLADILRYAKDNQDRLALLEAMQVKFVSYRPGSVLSWKIQSIKNREQINLVWKLGNDQQFDFTLSTVVFPLFPC
ncbi:MAG: hypothetical protein RLZ35_1106 [Pseudomonadota bacterium]|jgi:type II secretory pathway component PulK